MEQKALGDSWSDMTHQIAQAVVPALGSLIENTNATNYATAKLDAAHKAGKFSAGQMSDEYIRAQHALEREYIAAVHARAGHDLLAQSQRSAADAAKKQAEAEDQLYNSLHKSLDASFAYTSAVNALEHAKDRVNQQSLHEQEANLHVREAQIRLSDAIRQYGRDSIEAAAAAQALADANNRVKDVALQARDDIESLRQAYIKVADAAVDVAIKQGEVSGKTLSAAEKADIFRDKLRELAQGLAPNDPLRKNLQDYINQLNAIPTAKTTHITVDHHSAGGHGIQENLDSYAVGTRSVPGAPGEPHLAIVHGGEEIRNEQQQRSAGGSNQPMVIMQPPQRIISPSDLLAALYQLMQEAEYNRMRGGSGGFGNI
jgi:hypothetical protein